MPDQRYFCPCCRQLAAQAGLAANGSGPDSCFKSLLTALVHHGNSALVVARKLFFYNRFRFDFHQHLRRNQLGYFHHACRRTNFAENLAMCASNFLPVSGNIRHIHASSHHVFHASAGALQCRLNVLEHLHSLGVSIANADNVSAGVRGRGAGNMNRVSHTHSARISDHGFPFCSAGEILSLCCHQRAPLPRLSSTWLTRASASLLYCRKTWSMEKCSSFRTSARARS